MRIVAGRFDVTHERRFGERQAAYLPEHRAAHLAAVSGKRGKRYLKRHQVFDTGEAAVRFLTELTHRKPQSWAADVDQLHDMLQHCGAPALDRALHIAVVQEQISVGFVARLLRVDSGVVAS